MNKKPVETIMGIVVLLIAVLFLAFAYRVSDLQVVKGYELSARFFKVGGLNIGSDVRINGVTHTKADQYADAKTEEYTDAYSEAEEHSDPDSGAEQTGRRNDGMDSD